MVGEVKTEAEIRAEIARLVSEQAEGTRQATQPATPTDILQGWRKADEATAKIAALKWVLGEAPSS